MMLDFGDLMPSFPRVESPLFSIPHLVERPWGGSRLKFWGKELAGRRIGESWELAGLPGHASSFKGEGGQDLSSLCQSSTDPLGLAGQPFPLLVKLIDACENLSIQLHPREDSQEGRAKTEAWVILEAPEGARLYAGLRGELPARPLVERVAQGDLSPLQQIPVKAGDTIFVPSGTLHALTAGILAAEVQQSSDTTWRVWDWNRRDSAGNSRPLHIEQAVRDVDPRPRLGLKPSPLALDKNREVLCACPHFAMLRHRGETSRVTAQGGFRALMQLGESGQILSHGETRDFEKGATCLLPMGNEAELRGGEVLEAWVPDLEHDILEPLSAAGHSMATIRSLGAGTW
jgi:mannose-6-phosphate isomerase